MNSCESLSEMSLDSFLDEVKEDLFYDEFVRSLYEVTYAYVLNENDDLAYNKTIFEDVCGIDQENFSLETYRYAQEKIQSLCDLLASKQQDLEQHKSDERYGIIKKSFEYHKLLLEYTLGGLPFEAEKAGLDVGLSEREKQTLGGIQVAIDKKLFGEWVSEVPKEVAQSYHFLDKRLEKGRSNLTVDEQSTFESYLNKIRGLSIFDESMVHERSSESREEYKRINQELKDITLTRDEYKRIFELSFEFFGIDKLVVVEERSSIYDGPDALAIPSDDDYETRSAQKILELVTHEIGTHYITDANNPLGSIRGGWYLPKEEGLAVISEDLFEGVSLDDIDGFSISLPGILMGELLGDRKKHEEFYRLYYKLVNSSTNHVAAALRKQRGMGTYPTHKDVVYARGKGIVAEKLRRGLDIVDLSFGKLDFDDTDIMKPDLKMSVFPYMLADMVAYKMHYGKIDNDGLNSFLCKKYPFLKDYIKGQGLIDGVQKRAAIQMMKIFNQAKKRSD